MHKMLGAVLSCCVFLGVSAAYSKDIPTRFFGFDHALQPIALKWACGGKRDEDFAAFKALIAAFPEDAERAGIQGSVDDMQALGIAEKEVWRTIGSDLSSEQTQRLCDVALPLSIRWLTPDMLADSRQADMPEDQSMAWSEFWLVVQNLD